MWTLAGEQGSCPLRLQQPFEIPAGNYTGLQVSVVIYQRQQFVTWGAVPAAGLFFIFYIYLASGLDSRSP